MINFKYFNILFWLSFVQKDIINFIVEDYNQAFDGLPSETGLGAKLGRELN